MLNGRVTVEIVVIGLLITLLVYVFARKYLGYSFKKDLWWLRRVGLLILYAGTLLKEIAKSTWQVLLLIIAGDRYTKGTIVKVRIPLRTAAARTILANSITLTPGTITVSLDDDLYTIHALRPEFAEDLADSSFVQLLHRIEEEVK